MVYVSISRTAVVHLPKWIVKKILLTVCSQPFIQLFAVREHDSLVDVAPAQ